MKVLGIETSAHTGSIAITDNFKVLAAHTFPEALRADAELIPTLDELCRALSVNWSEVGLLAVDIGPGSYTGLRVGLATVKTLAYTSNKPVVPVTSFDTLVEGAHTPDVRYLCPVIDAKRKEVYAAVYERLPIAASEETKGFQRHWKRKSRMMVITPAQLVKKLPGGVAVLGSGLDRYVALFKSRGIRCLTQESWIPRAGAVAQLGEWEYRQGKQVGIHELAPLYLRIPQAEQRWQERMRVKKSR